MESLTTSGISPNFLASLGYHVSPSLAPGGCFITRTCFLLLYKHVNLLPEFSGPPSQAGVIPIPLILNVL